MTLRKLKEFDSLLKALSGLFNERATRLVFLGPAVRVDERTFARLHRLLGATTIGMNQPTIVVTSVRVDLLDDDELRFAIGYELGHALRGHAVHQTMLQRLIVLSGCAGRRARGRAGCAGDPGCARRVVAQGGLGGATPRPSDPARTPSAVWCTTWPDPRQRPTSGSTTVSGAATEARLARVSEPV